VAGPLRASGEAENDATMEGVQLKGEWEVGWAPEASVRVYRAGDTWVSGRVRCHPA